VKNKKSPPGYVLEAIFFEAQKHRLLNKSSVVYGIAHQRSERRKTQATKNASDDEK
jgi:hypothetical protein